MGWGDGACPNPGGSPQPGRGGNPEEPGDGGECVRPESPTDAAEADFPRLSLAEASEEPGLRAPCVSPETTELDPEPDPDPDTPEREPRLVRGHFGPVKRKGSGVRRGQGALLSMKEHSRSLDGQGDANANPVVVVDLNALLEREFSVQSLASAVNEDCFYEMADGLGSAAVIPTL